MTTLSLVTLAVVTGSLAQVADLPRATPESQGVDSAAILAFVEAADKDLVSLHSIMLLRRGKVVAEGWWAPYSASSPHSLFSLSKSFTSTAIGIAIAEGKLKLDDEVLKFFPEDVPAEVSANLKAMRVSDLLRMATGHQTEPQRTSTQSWVKTFLAHPVPFKPGTHFLYNTSATYMLSAIIQKVTGETLLDYLKPRLFEPLGIDKPTWEISPQGISTGGYGLSVKTEDIAKFGQLYLQKGKWNGKQLVPEAWVEAATSRQVGNGSNPKSDWDQGYGYQFWRSRNNAYRGDGAFGQFCIVLPEKDAVLVITAGLKDMQAVMNLVWDKLLPGLTDGKIEAVAATQKKLDEKLKSLTLPTQGGTSPTLQKVFGRKFEFTTNDRKLENLGLEGDDKEPVLVTRIAGTEHRFAIGRGTWQKGRWAWGSPTSSPTAASGAWTADDSFTSKVCFVETPFIVTVKLQFTGDEVKCEFEANVGFGATKTPAITGKTK